MKNSQDTNSQNTKVTEPKSIATPSPNWGPQKFTDDFSQGCGNFWISQSNVDLGRRGEDLVSELFLARGYKILKNNWRTPYGEVDLVLTKGPQLVICEVKTRRYGEISGFLFQKVLGKAQLQRLKRSATWIWQNQRRDHTDFRCGLVLVTGRGIRWFNLPLLYDQA